MTEHVRREPREIPGLSTALRADGYPHCAEDASRDVGGLLVGRLQSEGPPTVEATVRAVDDGGRGPSDQGFPYSSWDTLHSEIDRRFPGRQIVGWYGGRPGGGVGLTEHDRFIHSSFFTDPGQIAVIIDPHAARAAVFRWQGDRLVEHQSVRLVAEQLAPAPIVDPSPGFSSDLRRRTSRALVVRDRPRGLETALCLLAIAFSLGVIVWELFVR